MTPSERTFTYTWSDAKRLTVLHALGFMYAKLKETPPTVSETVLGLIGDLSNGHGKDAPVPAPADLSANQYGRGAQDARAILSPQSQTDYFARDRKGNLLVEAPEGATLQKLGIVGTAKTSKFLKVILRNAGTANCFDPQLWPILERHEGKEAGLWIKPSDDGKYKNVVGVRA
jgi:hypothetical protein